MPGLLTHISRYSLANTLVTLAGLISFPILTRLLGASGYGLLSIVNATLLLWVGFGKCGLQHASLRFYSEMQAARDSKTRDQFYSTVLLGMGGVGLATMVIWATISQLLPDGLWSDAELPMLFLITLPLIALRILDSAGVSMLRAREASGALSIYQVVQRYTQLAFVIVALLLIGSSIQVYFSAALLAEFLLLVVLLTVVLKGVSITPTAFSPGLFGRLLGYAVPMLGFEMASTLLNVGDRYVIQYYLGAGPLGVYSAAYNICMYVNATLIAAAASAILPAYLRVWENEGVEATRKYINRAMAYYVLLALPMAAGFGVVGGSVIRLLAPASFAAGAEVVPYIISGQFLGGLFIFFGAGLFVYKRSPVLTAVGAATALTNLALNLLLVPGQGIVGAAVATLLSYVLFIVLAFLTGRRALRLSIPWARVLTSVIGSLIMVGVIRQIRLEVEWLQLASQVAIGVLVYFGTVFALDAPFREQLSIALQSRLPQADGK